MQPLKGLHPSQHARPQSLPPDSGCAAQACEQPNTGLDVVQCLMEVIAHLALLPSTTHSAQPRNLHPKVPACRALASLIRSLDPAQNLRRYAAGFVSQKAEAWLSAFWHTAFYIMPSMPPMPPPMLAAGASSFGASATMHSVVSIRPATEAAFCSAVRVTLVGSRIPISIMSP